MLARHAHTHAETRQILIAVPCGCRGARAMRLRRAGSLTSAKCTKHASTPQDAARSSRVGKIARATRNQTHTAAKCILRVHSSSVGRGRRVSAARSAWRQCVQNGRVASRAHRRAAHHENTLAHQENKHAQSSNAYLHRTEAARRAGDAKHACARCARCC